MKKIIYTLKVLLFIILIDNLQANNVEALLDNFNQKNDLSQKTIDANKGHLVLFNRDKIEKIHAKTLKDILKTAPVVYHHENRLGLPDPLSSGAFESYRSNFIRLYIDGVEVTQGWMGSGLMLYGDVNIDFVDHIELYYLTPSFDTSVEPAYLTIFLYSKSPKRDKGTDISLVQGSRGENSQTLSYGDEKNNLSYMLNFSHTKAKRETISNGTTSPLNRNFERTQLFSYIKSENQVFHLQVLKKDTNSLAGMSYDATPIISKIDYLNLHIDYGISLNDYWYAQFAYDWLKTDMVQLDDSPLAWADALGSNRFNGIYKNSTYTAELTYKREFNKKHLITSGFKVRYKKLDSLIKDGIETTISPFNSEDIYTLFFQDQYVVSDKELLTLGISYNHISRNGATIDESLLQLRLGYIYKTDNWSYKTYLYRTQFAIEPLTRYLYTTYFQDASIQTTLGITEEITYNIYNHKFKLMLLLMQDEHGLLETTNDIDGGDTKYFFSIFDYEYSFNSDNKINLQLYYALYKNIFNLDELEDTSGYLSIINSYEDFDFHNSIVWHSNSVDNIDYFDVTSSISWNISNDLTLTLKGENILNRAKKTDLYRLNTTTQKLMTPLKISPIDQRITIELEYTF
ncbi:MAG: hypothetical protein QM493_11470 [Sulfurovum sp.]